MTKIKKTLVLTLIILGCGVYLGSFLLLKNSSLPKQDIVGSSLIMQMNVIRDNKFYRLEDLQDSLKLEDKLLIIIVSSFDGTMYHSKLDEAYKPMTPLPEMVLKHTKVHKNRVFSITIKTPSLQQSLGFVICPGHSPISPFRLNEAFENSEKCISKKLTIPKART